MPHPPGPLDDRGSRRVWRTWSWPSGCGTRRSPTPRTCPDGGRVGERCGCPPVRGVRPQAGAGQVAGGSWSGISAMRSSPAAAGTASQGRADVPQGDLLGGALDPGLGPRGRTDRATADGRGCAALGGRSLPGCFAIVLGIYATCNGETSRGVARDVPWTAPLGSVVRATVDVRWSAMRMISPVVVMRSAMCSRSASASGGAADRPAVGPAPHRAFTVLARAHPQGPTGGYPARPASGTELGGRPPCGPGYSLSLSRCFSSR